MRIVHVIPALTKGGAEKVVVDLANEAQRRGHLVSVITGYEADPRLNRDRLNPAINVQVVSQGERGKLAAYRTMLHWLWQQRDWFATIDVVHCHLSYASVLGACLKVQRKLRGQNGPAIVETYHGVGAPISAWRHRLAAKLAGTRDGFALMAEDPFWLGFIARHPELPSAIIPNGLAIEPGPPEDEVRAWRTEQRIPAKTLVIGTIGRIRAERSPLATIAAFAVAAKALPQAHFVMGGDGPMTNDVRLEAERLGFGERLHLPGLVVSPMIVLANIDLYLSMNVGPTTGIAGLEAAAAGVPVIAWQSRRDYCDGANDWIWSDPDPAVVGEQLVRLMRSPGELAALADRQHAHVAAHFSVSAMEDAYEGLYDRAVSGLRAV
jgi:glycosyltransferase involved in cell wall biosynthesis